MTLSSARSSDAADFAVVGDDDRGTLPVTQGTGRGGRGGRGRGPMSADFEGGRVDLMAVEFDGEHVVAGLLGRVFQFVRVRLRLFYLALLNDARGSWRKNGLVMIKSKISNNARLLHFGQGYVSNFKL